MPYVVYRPYGRSKPISIQLAQSLELSQLSKISIARVLLETDVKIEMGAGYFCIRMDRSADE